MRAYGGAFAEGLALNLGAELEEWVLDTREALAGSARRAWLALAEEALSSGDRRAAARLAEGALALAAARPLETDEFFRLHATLARSGSPARGRLLAEAASLGLAMPEGWAVAPNNLPTLLTSFVGRETERAEIAAALRRGDGRLLTLHGPGGVGKTRLALQAAQDGFEGAAFEDGVYFVPLDGLEDLGELPGRLAAALCATLPRAAPQGESLARLLGERRLLLVLDGFERLAQAVGALTALLAACPRLRLLVTSRERLSLKAERVLALDGLALPPPGADLEEAGAAEAVRLFAERAGQARLGFGVTAENLPSVLRVCELVGGNPLGLELAAAWTGSRSVADIARMLETDLFRLATPLRDVRERHRSVRASFEHSWSTLGREAKEALRRLAVFRGGFAPEAALAVAGATPELLADLADRSLVAASAGGRLGLEALVGGGASAKLAEAPRVARQTAARHAAYFVGCLSAAGTGSRLRAFVRDEAGNLLALARFSLKERLWDNLALLAEPLLGHLAGAGRAREALGLAEQALAALPEGDPQARAARRAVLAGRGRLGV